jgi:hypothetical protein
MSTTAPAQRNDRGTDPWRQRVDSGDWQTRSASYQF